MKVLDNEMINFLKNINIKYNKIEKKNELRIKIAEKVYFNIRKCDIKFKNLM